MSECVCAVVVCALTDAGPAVEQQLRGARARAQTRPAQRRDAVRVRAVRVRACDTHTPLTSPFRTQQSLKNIMFLNI